MNDKLKECLKPHAVMHSLFGLGLGIFLVALVPALNNALLGFIIMVVAVVVDYMRRS